MKKLHRTVIALLVVVLSFLLPIFSFPAGAEVEQGMGSENHGHKKFEMMLARGVISSYDFESDAPWLKIKDETGKEWTVAVDPKASKIINNGKEATWGSLKKGAKVEIVYAAESPSEGGSAKLVLHSVTVLA